jgi:uncharacterized repeat protein (TIGR01451 family)
MPPSSLPLKGRIALISTIVVALLVGFALPAPAAYMTPTGTLTPLSSHIQQNWGKDLGNSPTPLTNCLGTSGLSCFNPGTNLTWNLVLDICTSTSTVCTGAHQLPIKLNHVIALLEANETYIPGTETYGTSPSATATFSSGSCSSLGAPPVCATFTPTGTYLEWNFSSPTLTGHPQAHFTYNSNLTGTDGAAPVDYAIANYTYLSLNNNPIVDAQVFTATPILNLTKSCPTAVENNSAVTYHISMINSGHQNATGVVMTDTAPAGVTFTGASASAPSASFTAGQASWTGAIPALNGTVNVTVHANINTSAHSVTNYANFTTVPGAAVVLKHSASCTTLVLHPKIAVKKTVDPTVVSNLTANTITVHALVTNVGDTTLYNVTAVDTLAGTLTCNATTLAPGRSTNCTETYSLPLGTPLNFSNDTVNASGNDQLGTVVRASDHASVRIIHPSIAVAKSVDPTVVSNLVANTINVSATVTNTGDATLYNITVVDTLAGNLTCPSTTLAAQASMNCTGSYVIPKGTTASYSNDTVSAQGQDQFSNQVGPVTAPASVQIVHPHLSVKKVVDPTIVSNLVANTINVTATVTNTGDSTLYDVGVVDSLAGALSCPSAILAPNASVNCTGSYVIPKGTSASWSNDTVNASAQDQFGHDLPPATDNASVEIIHPAIEVSKIVDPSVVSNLVANTIDVTANVTNTGDSTLYNVSVTDSLAGLLTCPQTTLLAHAWMHCTGSYTIPKGTSASYSNDTVNATGQDRFQNTVFAVASASVQILHPAITVVKVVDPTVVSNLVANTIDVTANVTNSGDAPLSNITVVDSLAGPLTCPSTTLAVGASMNCTGSYAIPKGTLASYSNDTVNVSATDQFGNPLGASDNASVTILHPKVAVVKTVDPTVVSNLVTNTINVSANVSNTGDAPLSNITVVDSLAGTLTCPSTTLAVGAWMVCTGSYTIPKGTVESYSNDTVNVSATDQFGNPLGASDHASVQILHPAMTVVKVVDPTVVSNLVTNTIDVTANVTNTGDAPLSNISVVDSLAGPLTCPSTTLAVGASMNCTGSYTIPAGTLASWSNDTVNVTATDQFGNPLGASDHASVQILHPKIAVVKVVDPTVVSNLVANTISVEANVTNTGDATLYNISVVDSLAGPLTCAETTLAPSAWEICTGSYTIPKGTSADFSNDTVNVTANDTFGNPLNATDGASVTILHPALNVVKVVDPTVVSNLVGNTITVKANVSNTGDAPLSNITVVDSLAGTLTCPSTTLAVGAWMICTGSYTIPKGTSASYSNDTVNASGTDQFGHGLSDTANASVQIVHPGINVVKIVDPTVVSNLVSNTIDVSANVSNTGDAPLSNITVVDSLAGTLTCPSTTLAVGAWMICTGSYTIPKGTSESYSNDTVNASGTDQFGHGLSDTANASVQIVHPGINVVKVVDPTVVSNLVSNTIDVSANVSNTGDELLSNITVVDSLAGTLTCPSTTLAVGAWMVCTGSYTIPKGTSASFSNDTVNATGTDRFGNGLSDTSNASVQIVHPGINVVKVVDPTVVSDLVSNTITVKANVSNTGDAPLSNITVVDSLAGTLTCPSTTLAVGAWMICTGSYAIPKGTSENFSNDTVNASGTDQFGNDLSDTSNASVQIVHPALKVVKSVHPTIVSNLTANTITVKVVVTNIGDTTLYNLTVVDSLAGALSCATTTLAPGASTNCTGSYTIPKGTSASWSNDTANATATDGFGHSLSGTSSASVQIVHPSLSVVKSVHPTLVSNVVNNTISITAKVTNTGDTTLYNVTVTDSIAGALSCPSTTLAVGASMNCTGSYVIPKGTSATWSNDTVSAMGKDQFGNQVGPVTSKASVQIIAPSILVKKTVTPTSVFNNVNNTISITAKVTNTGDTTLYNVTVTDSIAGTLSCPSTTLAVGASMNCTGSYVIHAGTNATFSNDTVTANGCDAVDQCVTSSSNASVTIHRPTVGQVTDTNFCPLPSGEFRVIINGGQVKSTNPGQFYYNVYSTAGMTTGQSLTMTIPYPFVTNGATPGQVFEHLPPTCPSTPPSNALSFSVTPKTFGLSAFSPQAMGSVVTVKFTLTGPSIAPGVPLWFSLHLSYGLKGQSVTPVALGTSGCPTPQNNGTCARLVSNPTVVIGNLQPYTFGNSWSGTNTVASYNSFGGGAVPAAGGLFGSGSVSSLAPRIGLGLMVVAFGQFWVQRNSSESRRSPTDGSPAERA